MGIIKLNLRKFAKKLWHHSPNIAGYKISLWMKRDKSGVFMRREMAVSVFLRFLMHFKYLGDILESLRVGQRETVPRNLTPIPESIQATVQTFGTWFIEETRSHKT